MTTALLAIAIARMGMPSTTDADLARARILAATIASAARAHDVDPMLLSAIAAHESNFDRHRVGKLGERGRWQTLPATARHLGYLGSDEAMANDPINADLAAAWLAHVKAICARHGHTSEAAYLSKYRGDRCRPSAYSRAIISLAGMAREMPRADVATPSLVGALERPTKRKDR